MAPRVPLSFNPWFDYDEEYDRIGAPTIKQKALAQYLLDRPRPQYALIGLAPGYAGARFSGLPFVDENHLIAWGHPRTSTRSMPWSEASASTVIRVLKELDILDTTVMWNAYPFHPHQEGKPLSNRTPSQEEIRLHGDPWLTWFLGITSPGIVVPVGRAAEKALSVVATRLDSVVRIAPYVRHPSYGGDTEFARGMLTIVRGTG